jgi:peroxiredoxin
MNATPFSIRSNSNPSNAELTPLRVFKILLFSSLIWCLVAVYIRAAGPLGEFSPPREWRLFLLTFLATIPLNWVTRKVSGLPPEKTTSVIAVASIVPSTLEGILMTRYPQFYGGDTAIIGRAAAWLLFAIGVAIMLALISSLLANKRLTVGDLAPPIRAIDVRGSDVIVPGRWSGLTHVQFLRFAGCPVCNLHLQEFIERNAELSAAGIREIILFHSDANFIDDYYGELPFDMIADPQRETYVQYRIEKSPWAILSPGAWPGLVKAYRLKKAGKIDSTTFGLPADFLIDSSGRIVHCNYGADSSDQWSVDHVLMLVRDARSLDRHQPPSRERSSIGA